MNEALSSGWMLGTVLSAQILPFPLFCLLNPDRILYCKKMMMVYARHSILTFLFFFFLIGLPAEGKEHVVLVKKNTPFHKRTEQLFSTSQWAGYIRPLGETPQFSLFRLESMPDSIMDRLIRMAKEGSEEVIIESNHVLHLDQQPVWNDSLVASQWYLNFIHAEVFYTQFHDIPWRTVTVAVIDAGINWKHPDLIHSFWINEAEDINHNGIFDPEDVDGIDQDGNGYADDVIGYDFVDAPNLPSFGDYLKEDPFPDDEFLPSGHGTPVAGIIAALANNRSGIAGISPVARIMNLRAGTPQGYLETDDVIRAMLYAVNNGADIINMSFGDVVESKILRAVSDYAVSRGVLLVASAGNLGSSSPHFPAAFPGVIAVAALSKSGQKASFSNYGRWITCTAPGEQMISTTADGDYGIFNGTSFSAPVISATLSLLRYVFPDLSPEEWRNLLIRRLKDAGIPGFDELNGYGYPDQLELFRSLEGWVEFISPARNAVYAPGEIPVTATVYQQDCREFRFQLVHNGTVIWQSDQFRSFGYQKTFATIPSGILNEGNYELEIILETFAGRSFSIVQPFRISTQIIPVQWTTSVMFHKGRGEVRQDIQLSSPAVLSLRGYDHSGKEVYSALSPIDGDRHYYLSTPTDADSFALTAVAENAMIFLGGKKTDQIQPSSLIDQPTSVSRRQPVPDALNLGNVILLPKIMDWEGDGQPEILLSNRQENYSLQIWSLNFLASTPQKRLVKKSEMSLLPYDVADLNHDGKPDILAGISGKMVVFDNEQILSTDTLLNEYAFIDEQDCWPVRAEDLDEDGRNEVLVRKQNLYQIWRFRENWRVEVLSTFPMAQATVFSVPRILTGYFRPGKGKQALIADYYGTAYFFRILPDGTVEPDTAISGVDQALTDFSAVTDTDGDGLDEILFLTPENRDLNSDLDVADVHWNLKLLEWTEDLQQFTVQRIARFKGSMDTPPVSKGIWADGPRFSLSDGYEGYLGEFGQNGVVITTYFSGCISPYLFDDSLAGQSYFVGSNDGEVYIQKADKTIEFPSERPVAGLLNDSLLSVRWKFSAPPQDSFVSIIRWKILPADTVSITGKEGSRTIRIPEPASDQLVVSHFLMQNELNLFLSDDTLNFSAPPVISAEELPMGSNDLFWIRFRSSSPLVISPEESGRVLLHPGSRRVTDRFILHGGREIWMAFPKDKYRSNADTLEFEGLKDADGYWIQEKIPVVPVIQESTEPIYPEQAKVYGDSVLIYFNRSLVQPALADSLFLLIPTGQIEAVHFDPQHPSVVALVLQHKSDLVQSDIHPAVKIKPFLTDGRLTAGGKSVVLPVTWEDRSPELFRIYPNPCFAMEHEEVLLENVPLRGKVVIMTVNGEKVAEFTETGGTGGMRLNLRKDLLHLQTGVYIVVVKHGNQVVSRKWFLVK